MPSRSRHDGQRSRRRDQSGAADNLANRSALHQTNEDGRRRRRTSTSGWSRNALTPALEIFVDILSLDCDLLAAAVEDAPQTSSVPPAREFEQAAAHDRHLSMLAKRQADARRRVEALVITKRPGD